MKKTTRKKQGRNAKPSVQRKQRKQKQRSTNPPTKESTPVATGTNQKASKKDLVIALLQRENGATLQQLMDATGWQAHSVRGFISGTLRKKHGLTIERVSQIEGDATYQIPQDATA